MNPNNRLKEKKLQPLKDKIHELEIEINKMKNETI